MTQPVERRDLQQILRDHDERILALEREPFDVGGFGYEMARELLRPADFANYDADAYAVTFGNYGGTGALMTLVDALNDTAYFAVRLGPQGAMYHLQFICQIGPDCGTFEFSWATMPQPPAFDQGDSYDDDADPLGGTGLLFSPETISPALTWVSVPDWTGLGDPGDLYDPVAQDNQIGGNGAGPDNKYQQFRILGQPGDQATTMAAGGGGGYTFGSTDGGPGIWVLRVQAIDKDPASTGYNIRMSSLTIQREFWDNFSV